MASKSKPPKPAPAPAASAPADPSDETLPLKRMRFRQVPQVGFPVQYTVIDGQRPGAVRAAIITETFHQPGWETDPEKVCWDVSLTLFPPQNSPSLHEETHPPQVPYNDDPTERRTWRFIPPGIVEEDSETPTPNLTPTPPPDEEGKSETGGTTPPAP